MKYSLERDQYWMQQALLQAEKAKQNAEVPVGAVLVLNDELVAEGYNCPIATHDPTGHAEVVVLRKAAEKLQNYRLLNTILYVTLEPCLMCVGAMVHARIARLVFGAADPRTGAVQSVTQGLNYNFLNHKVDYQGGVLSEPCGTIIKEFFKDKR